MATDARLGILLVAEGTQQVEQQFNDVSASLENLNKSGGASIVALNQKLESFRNQLARVQALQKAAANVGEQTGLTTGITRLTALEGKLKAQIDALDASLGRFNRTATSSRLALIDVGRVLQDLPFGIIGVSNNINPLQESFARLKANAGSTGGAFRALFAELKGAGGVSLLLSAVTAAATFAAVGLTFFSGRLGKVKKDAEDAKTPLDKLAESIAGTTATDLTKLTAVVGVIENVNTANQERAKALKFVNDEYGPLLKSMGIEEVTLGNLQKAYAALVDEMLKQAVVKGLQKQISDEVEKAAASLIKLQIAQEKEADSSEKVSKAAGKAIVARKALNATEIKFDSKPIVDGALAQERLNSEQEASIKQQDNIQFQIDKIKAKLLETLKPALALATSLADLGLEGKGPTVDTKSLTEAERKLIELAKEAEKAFAIPVTLKFDDTDLAKVQLRKAQDVLNGIKDFTIKARIDIPLPDVKPLPKEVVEKFFSPDEFENALGKAVNQGLIAAQDKLSAFNFRLPELDPAHAFDKEIDAALQKLDELIKQHPTLLPLRLQLEQQAAQGGILGALKQLDDLIKQNPLVIPFRADLEDIINTQDLTEQKRKLDQLFQQNPILLPLKPQIEGIANAGNIGDVGAVFLANIQKALNKASESAGSFNERLKSAVALKDITADAALLAQTVNNLLTPAFQDMFTAIENGQAPLKAFFQGLIKAVEQLIQKLIAAAVEAAILSALNIGTGGFGGIFTSLLGLKEGGRYPVGEDVVVGEVGPEIVRFDKPGTVIPNKDVPRYLAEKRKERDRVTNTESKAYFEYLTYKSAIDKSATKSLERIERTFSINDRNQNNVHNLLTSNSHEIKDILSKSSSLTALDHLRVFDRIESDRSKESSLRTDNTISISKEIRDLSTRFSLLSTLDQLRVLDHMQKERVFKEQNSGENLLARFDSNTTKQELRDVSSSTSSTESTAAESSKESVTKASKDLIRDRLRVVEKMYEDRIKNNETFYSIISKSDTTEKIGFLTEAFERIEKAQSKNIPTGNQGHSANLALPLVRVLTTVLSTYAKDKNEKQLQILSYHVRESVDKTTDSNNHLIKTVERSQDWSNSFVEKIQNTSNRLILSDNQKSSLIERIAKHTTSAMGEKNRSLVRFIETNDTANSKLTTIKQLVSKEYEASKDNKISSMLISRGGNLIERHLMATSSISDIQIRSISERANQSLSFSPYISLNEQQSKGVIATASKPTAAPLQKISDAAPSETNFTHSFEPIELNMDNLILGIIRRAKSIQRTTGKNPFH